MLEESEHSMPCRPEKMEGQVVGGMLRLLRPWLRRPQAGLDWIAHFLFSRVTLFSGTVSSLKCFFLLFLLYLDLHLVLHGTGWEGFLFWFLELVMPSEGVDVVTASWPLSLFRAYCFRHCPGHPMVGRVCVIPWA